MIDNIVISKPIELPKEVLNKYREPFLFNEILFDPMYKYGEIQYYYSQIRNLRITISPYSSCIKISNSLHKFHAQGHNFGDFHFSHVKIAIKELSECIGINLMDARIRSIEYGCNLHIDYLDRFLKGISSIDGKSFRPMINRGKEYGMICERNQYSVKAYDKTYQSKIIDRVSLPSGLLRWELKVMDMRYLHKRRKPIPIYTLKDLTEYRNFKFLPEDICEKFHKLRSNEAINLSEKTLREKRVYASYMTKEIWNDLKIHHNATYKKDSRLLKNILAESKPSLFSEVGQAMSSKCRLLLGS